jgi:hypothetical protein
MCEKVLDSVESSKLDAEIAVGGVGILLPDGIFTFWCILFLRYASIRCLGVTRL